MALKAVVFFLVVGFPLHLFAKRLVDLEDPVGDDKGPGSYVYPTDSVYEPGSFDLTRFQVIRRGGRVVFRVSIRSKLKDPWNSRSWGGNGFSLQFVQVYIDEDHKPGSGFCDGLPGLNVRFKKESCWEKVVLISPQGRQRIQSELDQKAGRLKAGVVIPLKTRARGKTLEAVVRTRDLDGPPQPGWGYQVVMQSNEGYPDSKDVLTRKVNELPGRHRFGGGSDYDCDPHVTDILMAPGRGTQAEAKAQYQALKYHCDTRAPEKSPLVELPMVYPGGGK